MHSEVFRRLNDGRISVCQATMYGPSGLRPGCPGHWVQIAGNHIHVVPQNELVIYDFSAEATWNAQAHAMRRRILYPAWMLGIY